MNGLKEHIRLKKANLDWFVDIMYSELDNSHNVDLRVSLCDEEVVSNLSFKEEIRALKKIEAITESYKKLNYNIIEARIF